MPRLPEEDEGGRDEVIISDNSFILSQIYIEDLSFALFSLNSSLAADIGPAPHPLLAPLPALPDRGADEEEAHHHQLGPQVAPHIHILVINLVNIVNNLAIFTMLNLLLNLTILSENNYVSSLQRLVSDYRKPLEETQPPILSQAKVDMLHIFIGYTTNSTF